MVRSEYDETSANPASDSFPSSFRKEENKKDSTKSCRSFRMRRNLFLIFSLFLLVGTAFTFQLYESKYGDDMAEGVSTSGASPQKKYLGKTQKLTITTWNIAAINNNPFEYWLTMDENPEYNELMNKVESFIENPGELDIPVSEVFTEEMFAKLDERMKALGWESVESFWKDDLRKRKIVSGYMKDPLLGSKRLMSMPDRVTNTINVAGSDVPVCRPTVINMYDGDLSTLDIWFDAWTSFMFEKKLVIPPENKEQIPYQMLLPIKKAKYPDITEEEEKVSLPLQTLCGAIFDAILVHMMNTVSKPDVWQPLKRKMVDALNKQKVPKTLSILEQTYKISDIIMLEEVSAALIQLAKSSALGKIYHIIAPADMDPARDQNSVLLLNKYTFPRGKLSEITAEVKSNFPKNVDVPVAAGDILVITTQDRKRNQYVLASFHGDTNGLATIPVLNAIVKTKESLNLQKSRLIFGLDANTYEKGVPGKKQDVLEFGKAYTSHGLTSCWGDEPNPANYTTFNARTYLQPQLNKACKSNEKRTCGDVNPKDFILFGKDTFSVLKTWKDNTGNNVYVEDMAFPTLNFPSDHGLLSTQIQVNPLSDVEY